METCSDEMCAESHLSNRQHSEINGKVTKEKPGADRGGSGRLSWSTLENGECIGAPGEQVKQGGFTVGEKVIKVILTVGIDHQKPSLSHITLEIRWGVSVSNPFTLQEKVLKIIRATCPTA